MSQTVLSTRKLLRNQRELLLYVGLGLVEIDFIMVNAIPYKTEKIRENLIFTSKNAVRAILDDERLEEMKEQNSFCVGSKTADLLRKKGFKVIECADSGAELGAKIITHYKKEQFLFYCGKRRHAELPKMLNQKHVCLEEVEVYDTQLMTRKVDRVFDGVLFFSPSAVESFCSKNKLFGSIVFCIGKTTAAEAERYTTNIVMATKPTIENVIVQVIKRFRS